MQASSLIQAGDALWQYIANAFYMHQVETDSNEIILGRNKPKMFLVRNPTDETDLVQDRLDAALRAALNLGFDPEAGPEKHLEIISDGVAMPPEYRAVCHATGMSKPTSAFFVRP